MQMTLVSLSWNYNGFHVAMRKKNLGDNTPPCLTPWTIGKILEREFPHFTEQKHLEYQLYSIAIKWIGTFFLSNLVNNI